jgi:6-phosphogluconolactonase
MKLRNHFLLLTSLLFSLFSCTQSQKTEPGEILYVGTYSVRGSQGIYVYEFNRDSLTFHLIQTVDHQRDPSYLTISPDGKFLYAANGGTVNDSTHWGSVSAYSIDPLSGKLSVLNDKTSFGSDPCHIEIDHGGHTVFLTNYNDAVLTAYILNADGSISDHYQVFHETGSSVNPNRKAEAHVHSSLLSPDNKYVYVADLGSDKVRVYDYDQANFTVKPGDPEAASVIPGSGPRHMTIFPGLPYMYLVQEMSNTVSVFNIENEAAPKMIQTLSTLPDGFTGEDDAADIHIAPSGKFVYSSNRGDNSIAIFSVNRENGNLTAAGHHSCGGNWPRNFLMDPKGQYLFVANEKSDNMVILKMNSDSGELSDTGISISIPSPVCIKHLDL